MQLRRNRKLFTCFTTCEKTPPKICLRYFKICLTYFEICLTYFFLAPGELEKVPNPNAAKDMPHDIYVYVYVVIPAVHRAALAYVLACDLCCKYAPVAECRHKDSVKQ